MSCSSRAASDGVLRGLKTSQGHREDLARSLCQDIGRLSGSIAELSCLAPWMPAERGAKHSLRCAHRPQPCLWVVEYLSRFPCPKFSCPSPFFPAPSLENNPSPPRWKGDPREGAELKGCDAEEWRTEEDGKLSPGSPSSPLLPLSYCQTCCKRVLRGTLVTTPE